MRERTTSRIEVLTEDELRDQRIKVGARFDLAASRFKSSPDIGQWKELSAAMRAHQGYQFNASKSGNGRYTVTLYEAVEEPNL